jgi:hypothetical protein
MAAKTPLREFVVEDPKLEAMLRDKRSYIAYRRKEDMEREPWFPGNIFHVRFAEETIGEAQVILPEAIRFEDLTIYDAMVTGFQDVEQLRDFVAGTLKLDSKEPKQGFYKILYRWL